MTQWGEMLRAAARLGVGPEAFWPKMPFALSHGSTPDSARRSSVVARALSLSQT